MTSRRAEKIGNRRSVGRDAIVVLSHRMGNDYSGLAGRNQRDNARAGHESPIPFVTGEKMAFPYDDPIDIGQLYDLDEPLVLEADEVIDLLDDQLTDRRKHRIREVVRERTTTVIPIMDGIYDLGNAAAVLRSAEGLGYQEAHIIDTQPHQKASQQRVTQGADKWMDVHRWERPARCIEAVRQRGYRVVATHLEADVELSDVDFTEPTALVFGNEEDGISDEVYEMADVRCIIPVRGFVESFNISVAAAMSLYEAMRQRVDRLGGQGDLTDEERRILTAHFYMRAVTRPKRLIPSLWRRQNGAGA